MIKQEQFFNIPSNLVDICEETQRERSKLDCCLIGKAWAKEYCTIRLSGPRQIGHTTAALKLVENKFNKCIVVALNSRHESYMKDIAHKMGIYDKVTFVSGDLNKLRGLSEDYDAVIVDGAWTFGSKKTDMLYDLFAPIMQCHRIYHKKYDPFFFIFLQ